MSKVETHLRTAYYDYVDAPAGSPNPVVAPVPGPSTPSTFVTFYRVQPGQMPNPAPTCPGSSLKGAPCPPFELVTIQLNPLTPTELDEIVTLEPSGKVEPTTILGNNVSNFGVTAVEDSSGVGVPGGEYDIALTVTEPSNHCVNDQCSFTLNDVVYLGGQQ